MANPIRRILELFQSLSTDVTAIAAREAAYQRAFGKFENVHHSTDLKWPHIDLYPFPKNRRRDFEVLVTGGMSDAPPAATAPAAGAPTATGGGFDRRAMLQNITTGLILPGHEALSASLNELQTAVEVFAGDPNPTTLTAAQDAWLAANLARMAVRAYRIGPVDDSLLHNRLDNRPPRTPFIDDEILAGTMDITPEYIESIGLSSVGLGAMEYLLFDPANGDAPC